MVFVKSLVYELFNMFINVMWWCVVFCEFVLFYWEFLVRLECVGIDIFIFFWNMCYCDLFWYIDSYLGKIKKVVFFLKEKEKY